MIRLPAAFRSTHNTDGLTGYPAVDVFGAPGTPAGAPAAGVIENVHLIPWDLKKRVGGLTAYLVTANGTYFLTHFGTLTVKDGDRVQAGQPLGTIAAVPQSAWQPHIHEGLNSSLTSATRSSSDGFIPRGKDGQPVEPSPTGIRQVPGVDEALSVGKFLGRLTDPAYLLRGLQIVAGGGLVLVGTVLLARQVALAADLPDPAGLATKTASAAPVGAVE